MRNGLRRIPVILILIQLKDFSNFESIDLINKKEKICTKHNSLSLKKCIRILPILNKIGNSSKTLSMLHWEFFPGRETEDKFTGLHGYIYGIIMETETAEMRCRRRIV